MIFALEAHDFSHPSNQVFSQVCQCGKRIDIVLRVGGLFPVVQLGNRPCVIGDIQVPVFIAIEDAPVTTVYLRALRNKNVKYGFTVNLYFID